MLLVKLIGALFLCVTGFLSGKTFVDKLKRRSDALSWHYKAIGKIGTYIGGTAKELEDIIKSISGYSFYLTLSSPFSVNVNTDSLKISDVNLLTEFFGSLGEGEIEAEVARCKMYSNLLKEAHESARREYLEKSKLYKMLGLFAGLTISIVIM